VPQKDKKLSQWGRFSCVRGQSPYERLIFPKPILSAFFSQLRMQSPHRTHSGELGFDTGSSFKLQAFEHSLHEVHFSLSQRIRIKAIGLSKAYIAPSGQRTLQKKR